MDDDRKIKDIYDCDYIISDSELYPLQKWYNQLLDKRIDDINIADILRMMRQNEFIDIAIPKAIDCLKDNLFVGDMYEGEMLKKLSEMKISNLTPYADELKDILSQILNENREHDWLCNEEKEEFKQIANNFSENFLHIPCR